MFHVKQFDVIVIGGGHAGVEAAAAAARIGAKTALVTHRFDRLGEMSCNPAIGGLGKGHLVREVDAMDGLIARVGDKAAIQYRLLNRSKGPAVQGPRSQIDRSLYRHFMQAELRNYPNLEVIEGEAVAFRLAGSTINSLIVGDVEIGARSFALTTGTFLGGTIHIGDETHSAGRVGDNAAVDLALQLRELGLPMGRLKTGTPPRLKSSTINWDVLERQDADDDPSYFSFVSRETHQRQISCGISETNPQTHDIIRNNIEKSAMYSGNITGVGPRYCPSIEDKVSRFADKDNHQVFLEPEGLNDPLVYPNGISTSLPRDVQLDYVRTMKGLENVEITQFGYAIEYDYIDPRALNEHLGLRALDNLFFGGQINGTTGYEEAAAQGLVCGMNAALYAKGLPMQSFSRTQSYIGVMIDDLITRGVSEPYRMFTSRAEYRLSIRADNADQRLTPFAIEVGLAGNERKVQFEDKMNRLEKAKEFCESQTLSPNEAQNAGFSVKFDGKRRSIYDFLAFPNVTSADFKALFPGISEFDDETLAQLEIEAIYENYIQRQQKDVQQFERDRGLKIPPSFDYGNISGLSNELKQKLTSAAPSNIAEANRIEGITPAALALVVAHVRKVAS